MATRTGSFAIGFRRGWSDWQKDLSALAKWAQSSGFDALDIGGATEADVSTLTEAGLKLGTADLPALSKVVTGDPGERREHTQQIIAYIRQSAQLGAKILFTFVPAADPTAKPAESYRRAVESLAPIAEAAHGVGSVLVIEGWPGGRPHYANLCCNPEQYRALIKDLDGKGVAVNYDPSHLIRMGIDHIRFLREFLPHVKHVHAKDTEVIPEAVYELGLYQQSVFQKGHGFGEWTWRYTIPGHGIGRWTEIFTILKDAGYKGIVSVELEDANFNGSEEGEKAGLIHSLNFLRGA